MAARARGEGKTPHRQFRLEGHLWDKFEDAVKQAGTDRSTALRAFVEWFVREQGAKMPKRPPAVDTGSATADESPQDAQGTGQQPDGAVLSIPSTETGVSEAGSG